MRRCRSRRLAVAQADELAGVPHGVAEHASRVGAGSAARRTPAIAAPPRHAAGSARAKRRSVSPSLPGASGAPNSRSAVVAWRRIRGSRRRTPVRDRPRNLRPRASALRRSAPPPIPERSRRENARRTARRIRRNAPAAAPTSRARRGGCRRSPAARAARSRRATPWSARARPRSPRAAAAR
jgi:hypothetical protein